MFFPMKIYVSVLFKLKMKYFIFWFGHSFFLHKKCSFLANNLYSGSEGLIAISLGLHCTVIFTLVIINIFDTSWIISSNKICNTSVNIFHFIADTKVQFKGDISLQKVTHSAHYKMNHLLNSKCCSCLFIIKHTLYIYNRLPLQII